MFFTYSSEHVKIAVNGEIDYSSDKTFSSRINKLNGEWKIVFDQFLPPDTDPENISNYQLLKVPQNWNKIYKPTGFATYLLKIKVPDSNDELTLLMPAVSTAYKLYINGQLAAKNGVVGKTTEESRPQYYFNLVDLGNKNSVINIVIHISNYHYSKGGLWISPSIGIASKIKNQFLTSLFFKILVSGGLLLIGFSLMTLYFISKKFSAYLSLGIFNVLMAARTLSTGEITLTHFFPSFPWSILIRIEFLTMTLGILTIVIYFYNLYKKHFNFLVFRIFIFAAIIFSIVISVTPVILFTRIVVPVQILLIMGIIYAYILLYSSRKELGSERAILLFGFTIFQLMIVNDILLTNNMIHFNPFIFNTSFGFFIFIISNDVILIKRAIGITTDLEHLTQIWKKLFRIEPGNWKLPIKN